MRSRITLEHACRYAESRWCLIASRIVWKSSAPIAARIFSIPICDDDDDDDDAEVTDDSAANSSNTASLSSAIFLPRPDLLWISSAYSASSLSRAITSTASRTAAAVVACRSSHASRLGLPAFSASLRCGSIISRAASCAASSAAATVSSGTPPGFMATASIISVLVCVPA